jgi:hypothetical protein
VTASGPVPFKQIASQREAQKKKSATIKTIVLYTTRVRAIGFEILSIAHLGPDLAF